MTEKNIIYSLIGGQSIPTTIVPLYRTNHGAKILSLKADIWIPGYRTIPFPSLDEDNTPEQDTLILVRNEFDNAQILLHLFMKDLSLWHFIRTFPIVNRGTLMIPDLLASYTNHWGYLGLQKGYAIGVSFEFLDKEMEEYEYITIRGHIEESVLPENEIIDDTPIEVPEQAPVPAPTPRPEPPPPIVETSILTEAETGDVVPPMEIGSEPSASGGRFVLIREGVGSSGGLLRISFQVPTSRNYAVWGRVKAPNAQADSFYVQIDSLAAFQWGLRISTDWSWQRVKTLDGQNIFALNEGGHTVKIITREDGVAIDQLLITSELEDVIVLPTPPTPTPPTPTPPTPTPPTPTPPTPTPPTPTPPTPTPPTPTPPTPTPPATPLESELELALFTSPLSVEPGGAVAYTFRITNTSSETITGITVENSFPPELTFVSAMPDRDFVTVGNYSFTGGSLLPSQSVHLAVNLTLPNFSTGIVESETTIRVPDGRYYTSTFEEGFAIIP